MPRISVIIPAFNAAPFIRDTLESITSQGMDDLEILVIDDGSMDETAAIAGSFTGVNVIRQENAGVSAARNTGIEAATAPLLFFIDADDIAAPGTLSRYLQAFQAQNIVLAYGEAPPFQSGQIPGSTPRRGVFSGRPEGYVLERLIASNPIGAGSAVVRRDIALNVGGFPSHLTMGEDWAFWCKVAAHGPIKWIGPEPAIYYRQHSASAARTQALSAKAMWPAIEAVFTSPFVANRFLAQDLPALRRRCECHWLAYAAQEMLKAGRWTEARQTYQSALLRRPAFIRTWILWACATARFIPAPIQKRL